MTLNEQLTAIYEWLCCNKLLLNVLKTHYMIFTPRNKKVNDINVYINKMPIARVYVTKFLGIQIDSQLNWKNHIEYTCRKLSKCIGILSRARRKSQKSSLISLYYSFAFPYFIYCNHVWGSTYQTNLNNVVLVQKKLIRILTCSPFRAHTEPLLMANRLMSLSNINMYMTCIFVYQCLNGCVPDIFNDFYACNRNIHVHDTRQASDLNVPYGRLDIRQNRMKIHGANMWNSIPENVKMSESVYLFKQILRNSLLDRNNMNYDGTSSWRMLQNHQLVTVEQSSSFLSYFNVRKWINNEIFVCFKSTKIWLLLKKYALMAVCNWVICDGACRCMATDWAIVPAPRHRVRSLRLNWWSGTRWCVQRVPGHLSGCDDWKIGAWGGGPGCGWGRHAPLDWNSYCIHELTHNTLLFLFFIFFY